MGSDTSIQWTDATWNPVRGCSRVSAGCTNCYAEKVAARFSGPGLAYEGLARLKVIGQKVVGGDGGASFKRIDRTEARWTGEVRLVPEHLADPLRWTRPRRVFVNSMSDLFHDKLSNEDIAAVFGVMAAAPRHTFQVLTKRAERMREWFAWVDSAADEVNAGRGMTTAAYCFALLQRDAQPDDGHLLSREGVVERALQAGWPLPNVHLGVSVEDQGTADGRIPDLLATPAAVRFVSYEPALGPVDFAPWIEAIDHCGSCEAENSPQGPDKCPSCGDEGSLISTYGHEQAERYRTRERYENGGPRPDEDGPQLHWVIVGGESGHGARPFDIAWARSTVEQCRAAGVAVFVKQLGAYPVDNTRPSSMTIGPDRVHMTRNKKGGDPAEWPEDLRVREFPSSAAP